MVRPVIFSSWSIRNKLLALVFVVFLPAAGIIIGSGLAERRDEISAAQKVALLLVQGLAVQQKEITNGTKQMLTTLSQLSEVQNLNTEACSDLFRKITDRQKYYSTIALEMPDGNMIASSDPFEPGAVKLSDRKHIKETLSRLDFSVGEYVVGRTSNVPSIHYSYPVLDENNTLLAILSAGFRLDDYVRFIEKVSLPEGSVVLITDCNGRLLYRSPENGMRGIGQLISGDALREISGDLVEGTYEKLGHDGIRRVYAFEQLRLLEDLPPYLYLIAGIAKDPILQKANHHMWINLSILGLTTVVALSLAWFVAGVGLIRPIRQLVLATQQLGRGDASARTGLMHTEDELGHLAKSFDTMASLLEEKDTERRLAEEALMRLYRHNQLILDAAGEGIVGLDNRGTITFANPAAREMLGYEADELIGNDLHELAHNRKPDGTPYPASECPMVASLSNRVPNRIREEVLRRKDGSNFPCVYSSTPILEGGEVKGAVITFRDVTDRKQAEEARELLEIQLRQAHKLEAIGTLAGGIAHDFNNILAIILGYTELALMDIPPDAQPAQNLSEVLKATRRAKDLVQQILTFGRRGEAQARQPVDIVPVIKETLKLLRASLPSTIELKQQISSNVLTILGDSTQLHQVLLNLCTNAAHAMRDVDGILEVEVGEVVLDRLSAKAFENLRPGSYVQLTVRDNGHGMDAATVERIFDPYFTTKKVGEGSGLGLAVAHGIVKRHEGGISVQSSPGKGTVFRIFLPRIEDAQAETRIDLMPPRGGAERILFVDDEVQLAALGQRMLTQLGYHVVAKASSLDAIDLFRSEPNAFDLVITDFTMPHKTGVELSREMLHIRSDIPIVLCTGYSEMVDERTAKEAGIKALAMKPLDSRSLAGLIREVLDNS
jgi:PAS domain S-box-containing protein